MSQFLPSLIINRILSSRKFINKKLDVSGSKRDNCELHYI